MDLPDPDDRHVLAAAIGARAQVIVTRNLADFPDRALRPWDVEAKSPDDFVFDQIDLNQEAVYGSIKLIADSRTRPPATVTRVIAELERDGLAQSAEALRTYAARPG